MDEAESAGCSVGIMQGRLTSRGARPIQFFPIDEWADEFRLAARAGLDCIEWVYEAPSEHANPLRNDAGVDEILAMSDTTGVEVSSVCADYYMAERLVEQEAAVEHLRALLPRAARVGARYVVLPFVDSSSLQDEAHVDAMVAAVASVLPAAEAAGVELHLETDLSPSSLEVVFGRLSHPLVRLNYDIGNSASLGHDPREELTRLGELLGSVHVKDRVLGGGTVPLGEGDADFESCFEYFATLGFSGPFILQVAPSGDDELGLAVQNRRFVEEHIRNAAAAAH